MPTYTYTFLAKDLMSSKLAKIQQAGSSGFIKIDKARNRFTNNLDRTNTKLNSTGLNISKITGLAAKFGVAFSAASLIKDVVALGAEMEQTRISFTTMLGSADKANTTISKLNKFSNVTPFSNKEVIGAGRNLLAFGVSTEKLLPSLKAIGDVSAGLKIPFNDLSAIYGKIKVSQTVYSEDLNQLAGRGIPIFTELSKVMGVAPDKIKKLASQGKIAFPQIEQAFTNMTSKGGQFAGLMEKQSKSLTGKWSTLKGKAQSLAIVIGEKLVPYVSKFVGYGIKLIEVLPKIPAFFSAMYQSVVDNAVVIGLLSVAFVALNANLIASKISFLAFSIQFKAYTLWTKIATAGQWLWNAALTANPIGLVVAGVALLVAGIVLAYNKIGWFRGGLLAAWESIKGFGLAIKDFVVDRIKQMITGITGIGKTLVQFFKGDWKKAWQTGKEAAKNLTGFGVGNGSKFINNMKATGKNAALAYKKGVAEVDAKKKKKKTILGASKTGASAAIGADDATTVSTPPKDLSKGINAIAGGGKKQTNITVTFDKLVENFTISTQNVQQGFEQSEDALKEMLLRVLNSANQMQTN